MIHSEGRKRPRSRPPVKVLAKEFLEEARVEMKGLTDDCLDAILQHQKRLIALGSVCPRSQSAKIPKLLLFFT